MKIIVLDGHTLNPGDLSWKDLESIGELHVYDRTKPEEIVDRARHCDILFTNKTPLDGIILRALKKLRYIGVLATGYNVVDIETAKELGIVVTNIPTYGTNAVAQMVFAHILEICHHVGAHSEDVKNGGWAGSKDFCYWNYPLIELAGKKIGIVGLGKIGKVVARIAQAFEMDVLAVDTGHKKADTLSGIKIVDLDHLLKNSDIISLHCPLTKETEGVINRDSIRIMKEGAILVNTSRGQLINEQDLADALNEGKIAAAGLDVLSNEPPHEDNPLIKAKNCIITPHIAWAPKEARERLMDIAVGNLKSFLDGSPVNVVN